jgi:hypothetical protein
MIAAPKRELVEMGEKLGLELNKSPQCLSATIASSMASRLQRLPNTSE